MQESEREIINYSKESESSKAEDGKYEEFKGANALRIGLVLAGLAAAYSTVGKDCSCKSCTSCSNKPEHREIDRGHIPPSLPRQEQQNTTSMNARVPNVPSWLKIPKLPKAPKAADNLNSSEAQSHEEVFNSIKRNLERNGALVVTSNHFQLNECVRYLQYYSGREITDRDAVNFNFEHVFARGNIYIGTKVTIPVKIGRRTKNITVYVISQQNLATEQGKIFTEGKKFSFVQLRGHTGDMGGLIRFTQNHKSPVSLTGLGGCSSIGFKSSICTPQTPVITQVPTGYSKRNSYLLIRVIDEIMRNDSWEEMFEGIADFSSVARAGHQDNIPGQRGYESGCEGWNNFPKRISGISMRRKIASLRQNRDQWKLWRREVMQIKARLKDREKIAYLDRQVQFANNQVGQFATQIEFWKGKLRQRQRRRR